MSLAGSSPKNRPNAPPNPTIPASTCLTLGVAILGAAVNGKGNSEYSREYGPRPDGCGRGSVPNYSIGEVAMKADVLSKMREIIRVAQGRSFRNSVSMAQWLYEEAPAAGEESPFRLLGTLGGNAATVSSVLTIRKHVDFCEVLRLIQFHDPNGLLEYQPLVSFDGNTNAVIEKELWAYLGREGVSKRELRAAMKKSPIHDPMSIWGAFPVRNIPRDTFRRCVYLISQVSAELVVNRKWTYHFQDELKGK
jgi:hypothetical protein